jgi:glycosyltransferase involved in cell wall biosynthesis
MIYNRLERQLLRWPTCIIAVSPELLHDLPRAVQKRRANVEIVSNAVVWQPADFEARHRIRRELEIAPDAFVVGAVGRLTREKDHRTLIKAVSIARNARVDAQLVLVGEGPERQRLMCLADSVGIRSSLYLTGYQANVAEYLTAFDVFVLPSRCEGSPNALLEALAAGLPIVASDIPGVRSCVGSERACLLFPPGDETKLAAHIIDLHRSPALRDMLAEKAVNEATRFDPQKRAIQLTKIYRALINSSLTAKGSENRSISSNPRVPDFASSDVA